MRCPNCGVTISSHSNFCNYCGVNLKPMQIRKSFKWMLAMGALLVCSGMLYIIIVDFQTPTPEPSTGIGSENQALVPGQQPSRTQPQPAQHELPKGMVTIRDISGSILSQIPVAVVSKGWIALPLKTCYGGYGWSCSLEPGKQVAIEWGILHEHDEVGLWRLEKSPWVNGPKLVPWATKKPLGWLPIESDQDPVPVKIDVYDEQGKFAHVTMPAGLKKPGVFLQGDGIVGWSFGQVADGGYLWMGRKGVDLIPDFRVEDFYRRTFADSREEQFAMAIAREDYTDLGLLAALADGFGLESRIPVQSVPPHLRSEPIIARMRSILKSLVSEENFRMVAEIFDSRTLIQTQDPSLLADVISAVRKSEGFEYSLGLMENVLSTLPLNKGIGTSRLEPLHSQLYQGWLRELMEDGDIAGAARALESADIFFPEDPKFHLLNVRLALEKKDWEEAERLLSLRQYPKSLQDMVDNLDNRISQARSLEGKIMIRFVPGSKYVPIHAHLNATIHQEFIIDTGATLSTIPYATARNLGIRIDHTKPIRMFYTAAGIKEAPEVILSSVKIGQWVIHDVKALVVDLPRQPDLGLLGLNYLNHFRMNLSAEEGLLTLEPR